MTLHSDKPSVRPRFLKPLAPQRLLSLDVFRGMVIVAMLVVNNIGDPGAVGYFWKHAGWIEQSQADAYERWWLDVRLAPDWQSIAALVGQFPLLRHCTLADYVMPLFILIIGVTMPIAIATRKLAGTPPLRMWLKVLRRAVTLVVLGWAIAASMSVQHWRHSTEPDARLTFTLGMDVLQLLGLAYLVARILYELPLLPRVIAAGLMLVGHWAILRLLPQGDLPPGTFNQQYEAIGHIYRTWAVFQPVTLIPGRFYLSLVGILSVVPTAATMLLGTWAGEWLQRNDLNPGAKVRELMLGGLACAAIGFVWAFDLPFNKPRWTPAYLLWCSGAGVTMLAILYWLVDLRGSRWWTRLFVVFGMNSIAVYWLSIMFKIWTINMIQVTGLDGQPTMLTAKIVRSLQALLNGAALGSWAFTILFVGIWWLVLEIAYRKKIFWRL